MHSLSVCDCKGTTFSWNLQMFWRFFFRKSAFSCVFRLFYPCFYRLKWSFFGKRTVFLLLLLIHFSARIFCLGWDLGSFLLKIRTYDKSKVVFSITSRTITALRRDRMRKTCSNLSFHVSSSHPCCALLSSLSEVPLTTFWSSSYVFLEFFSGLPHMHS